MPRIWINAVSILVACAVCAIAASAQSSRPTESAPPPMGPPEPPDLLSVAKLIREAANPLALTYRPEPVFESLVFSSTTETSADRPKGFLRAENKGDRVENVMAEAKGPGVITRMTIAHAVGTLRVYCDESPLPVLEVPADLAVRGGITLLGGPFSGRIANGGVIRFPMPFAKSMKVTSDGPITDYDVAVRVYPQSTKIDTFQVKEAIIHTFRTRDAIGTLSAPASAMPLETKQSGTSIDVGTPTASVVCPPDQDVVAFTMKVAEPSAIMHLGFIDATDGNGQTTEPWSSLEIRITFDGRETVRAPLDRLLGITDPHAERTGFFLGAERAGLLQHRISFPMPFRENVTITLRNGGRDVIAGVLLQVKTAPYAWTKGSLSFHADATSSRTDLPAGSRVVAEVFEMRSALDQPIYSSTTSFSGFSPHAIGPAPALVLPVGLPLSVLSRFEFATASATLRYVRTYGLDASFSAASAKGADVCRSYYAPLAIESATSAPTKK